MINTARIKELSMVTIGEFKNVLHALLLIAKQQNNTSVCETITNTLDSIQDFNDNEELTYLLECIDFKDINLY